MAQLILLPFFRKSVELFSKVSKLLSDAGLKYSKEEQSIESDPNASKDETVVQRYVRLLKPLQFLPVEFSSKWFPNNTGTHRYLNHVLLLVTGAWAHKYSKNAEDKLSSEIRTIWKEWSSLRESLPINLKSSIFVRYVSLCSLDS